jgi:hypothetical protein
MQMPQAPVPPGILGKIGAVLKKPVVYIPLLILLVLLILVGGSWLIFDSWLVSMVVALVVVLIALVVILLRTLFAQEKEEHLGRGISDQPQFDVQQPMAGQAATMETLDSSFARALREIRNSRLGADGLYTLPWLLVLGELGAGKSAMLRTSGLELPAEYAHIVRAGPTRDCDWWLTNQAIVLDTSGRYLEADSDELSREWRQLLTLLRRSRPKVPLDHLILAIPVTTLFGRAPDEQTLIAHTLRRRINELTDILSIDIPIYVVITKCDLIEGFVETVNMLPPERLQEALGWTNDRRTFADAGELVEAGLDPVRTQLEGLLPEMVLRETDPRRRRKLFLFPQEFEDAVHALAHLLRQAFAPSSYGDVPFLRGVYFTSAQREGATLSLLLQRLGHEWARSMVDPQSTAAGGLFTHDVFREIVTGDENLAMPHNWMGPRTRKLVVGTTAALTLISMLLMGFSSVENFQRIRRLSNESDITVAGASSLASIEKLRTAIAAEEIDRIPLNGFGLNGPGDVAIERARKTFVWAFGREFEEPTKNRLLGRVRSFDRDAFEALAELGLDVKFLAERGKAPAPDLLAYAPIGRSDADVAAFRNGYADFVRWIPKSEVRARVEHERDAVGAAAPRLLDLKRLEQWSRKNTHSYPPMLYSEANVPIGPDDRQTDVTGAYTRRAWDGLVRDLIEAVEETGGASSSAVQSFRDGYVRRYDTSWRNFLMDTPENTAPLSDVKKSPYLELMASIGKNVGADLPRVTVERPVWMKTLDEFRRDEANEREAEEKIPPPWTRYQLALDQVEADLASVEGSKEASYDLAVRLADPDATSFSAALKVVRELIPTEGDPRAANKMRKIFSLPILDGASAVLTSASEELEQRWRDRIADPYSTQLNKQGIEALYDPETGDLSRFRSEDLDLFYADGRTSEVISDRRVPLGPQFLAWMDAAEGVQRALFPGRGASPNISVRLEGVPSQVVGRSSVFVTRRDLRVACDEGVSTFVYREGMGSQTFSWSPDCEGVSLRIWARGSGGTESELLPRQEWNGPLAFPQFMQEAQRLGGRRLQWRFQYDQPTVELIVEYRLRSGDGIMDIAHRPPPTSIRE